MLNSNHISVNQLQQLWLDQPSSSSEQLQQVQSAAMADFAAAGFPTNRLEDWKYTDVGKLTEIYPDWQANKPLDEGAPEHSHSSLKIEDAIHLSFINGSLATDLSTQELPEGLMILPIEELASRFPEIFQERFGSLARTNHSGFVAVNTVFSGNALAVIVAANTELEQPVYIEHFSSAAETSCHPRLFVELGQNSKATLVEHFVSIAPVITNAVCEIYCSTGAHISYDKLQEEHSRTFHTAVQFLHLAENASSKTTTVDAGSELARNELNLRLAGTGADADAKGLLLADGSRHVDSRICVEHAAPNTTSRERYRSILADKARGVFNGRILVEQNAQKTSAQLSNRNLLLNAGAEIDTKPELEIYADDVKCAHGSTTGQLDDNSMFYLLSRGIDPLEARNMLVRAFAGELLADIEVPAIAESLQSAIESLRYSE